MIDKGLILSFDILLEFYFSTSWGVLGKCLNFILEVFSYHILQMLSQIILQGFFHSHFSKHPIYISKLINQFKNKNLDYQFCIKLNSIFSCVQTWSVCLSIRLSVTPLEDVPLTVPLWIFQELPTLQKVMSMQKFGVKGLGNKGPLHFCPSQVVSRP